MIATLSLRSPYLIFLGSESNERLAKTGLGIAYWSPDSCVGQIRLSESTTNVGLPDMTVPVAAAAGAESLVIGTAAVGGSIRDEWVETILEALKHDMDIVGGLHTRLNDNRVLVEAASCSKGQLIDVRVPPMTIPVGSGRKRTGLRALTVGTDCAVGKKYTALALAHGLQEAGLSADFRASGQTGIMIAGSGIPMDAVVSDFLSGAAEMLSPDASADHWDVIEGQGSLFHPGYAAVSLGLLHGSQPDAIIVCTEANRQTINRYDDYPVPSLSLCIHRNLEAARLTNPDVVCAGISVNTSVFESDEESASFLEELSDRYDMPAVDPVRSGVEPLVAALSRIGTHSKAA